MSQITGTFRGRATVDPPTTVTVYNKVIVTPNSEVSQALSSGTKKFRIKARGSAKIQLAFVATESGSNYITIWPGAVLLEDDLNFSGTLYFQTSKATTVEIWEWT